MGRAGRSLDACWPEIVGPQIASVARVEETSGGVLRIAVRSPSWESQLRMMTPRVLKGIQEFGFRNIRSIEWRHPWSERV